MRHVSWYGPHLTITPRPAYRVATGTLEVVERFSGVELVDVPSVGVLEAFYDGLLPWIHADSVLGQAAVIDQKTLRWPGFSAKVLTLSELGLLSETPVATPEGPARPRAVLDAVLRPHIERRPEDEDVTVLAVEATGSIAGSPATRSTTVVATSDPNFGVTGMGRLTGSVLASAVRLLGEHVIPNGLAAERLTGVIHAHEAFSGDRAENLLDSLRCGGVSVVDCPHSWTGRVGGEAAISAAVRSSGSKIVVITRNIWASRSAGVPVTVYSATRTGICVASRGSPTTGRGMRYPEDRTFRELISDR